MGGVPQQVGTVWGVCPTENFIKAVSNEGMLDYPALFCCVIFRPSSMATELRQRGASRAVRRALVMFATRAARLVRTSRAPAFVGRAASTCIGRTAVVGAARAVRPFLLASPVPQPSSTVRPLSTGSKGTGVVEVTDEAEYSQALASKGLCVVYFTASWCAACAHPAAPPPPPHHRRYLHLRHRHRCHQHRHPHRPIRRHDHSRSCHACCAVASTAH